MDVDTGKDVILSSVCGIDRVCNFPGPGNVGLVCSK